MTNQYQLDTEYRNRQMAAAEKALLVQEAQAHQPKRNILRAIASKVQQFVGKRQQPAEAEPSFTVNLTDTQNMPTVS